MRHRSHEERLRIQRPELERWVRKEDARGWTRQRPSMLVLVVLCGCGQMEPDGVTGVQSTAQIDAMRNGHVVSDAARRRSGIVWVGNCTGTVFRTSSFHRKTWVITAGHCFGAATGSNASLYDKPGGTLLGSGGTWTRHGDYQTYPFRHDIAIVEYPFGVTVDNADSTSVHEYYRPFLPSNDNDDVAIFGMGVQEEDGFCAGTQLEWDHSLRYAIENDYDSLGYGMIETNSFDVPAAIRPGDSGGPWLSTYYNSTSLDAILEDGIITAITSNVECGNSEVEGSSAFAGSNESFIANTAGNAVVFASSWSRPACWTDWCNYSDTERASLIVAALGPV